MKEYFEEIGQMIGIIFQIVIALTVGIGSCSIIGYMIYLFVKAYHGN